MAGFVQEHLAGRPELTRRVFELAGLAFRKPPRGDEYEVLCPFHPDHNPSLNVNLSKAVYVCRVCTEGGDVVDFYAKRGGMAVDVAIHEIRERLGIGRNGRPPTPIRSWAIRDIAGNLRATHLFFGYDADGKKDFPWDQKGVKPANLPLYGSERLATADPESTLILCEGEKAADALLEHGIVAVGTVTGASGTPGLAAFGPLRGRDVVLWPDYDDAGRRHMDRNGAAITGIARSIRILSWGEQEKDDAFDFFARGGTLEQLDQMLADAPEWQPNKVVDPQQEKKAPPAPPWPDLPVEALYGLAGDVVTAIDPHTEAAQAAILTHFLIFFGNCVGVSPHVRVGGDEHRANEFAVLVGKTSKGRKGTSEGQIRRLFEGVDDQWAKHCLVHGLSSGEGLIHALEAVAPGQAESTRDPRICAMEPEFANVLRVMQRDGNTLSGVLRQAWDRGSLRVMTRKAPLQVDDVHVSAIAHVTSSELLATMDSGQTSNGFANRFLWIGVHRSKVLANPLPVSDSALTELRQRISAAIHSARRLAEVRRSPEAERLWESVYTDLSAERPGLVGVVTSRAEAHVIRLALLYALLDTRSEIREEHLTAALAFWRFSAQCVTRIFGGRLGNAIAWRILLELREMAPAGISRNDMSEEIFGKNLGSDRLESALQLLEDNNLARRSRVKQPKGRPPEVWYAVMD